MDRKLQKKKDREKRIVRKLRVNKNNKTREENLEKEKIAFWEAEYEASKKVKIPEQDNSERLKKIKHNMEILKALEEEYLKEKTTRDNANASLEKEGAVTMEDKIKILQAKTSQIIEHQKQLD